LKRIAIIQPVIPRYRVEFFKQISQKYNVEVFACKEAFGVKSILNLEYAFYTKNFIKFKIFFWHKYLPIYRILSEFDIIVINGNMRILNYMLLYFLALIIGKPIVWWGHLNSAGGYGIGSRLRIYLMNFANSILLYTDDEVRRYPYKRTVYALNNGLSQKDIKHALKKYPPKINFSGPIKLAFIGRLNQKSGIKFLLQSVSLLNIKYTLDVIGDGPLKGTMENYVISNNLSKNITFHGEVNNEIDIARILSNKSLSIYPGSVGLSLIHSFNYYVPMIIHDNIQMHMPEATALKNGVNGFLFEYNDKRSLSNKIEEFYKMSVGEQKKIASNANKTVKETFNVENMVLRFITCIESI
jgi:glycosyltransferase involved in cell wall biosynthesis